MEGVKLLGGISAGVLEDDFLSLRDGAMRLITMIRCIPAVVHPSHFHIRIIKQQMEKKSVEKDKINFRIFLVLNVRDEPCSAFCCPWCMCLPLSGLICLDAVLIRGHGQQTYLATGVVVQEGRDIVDLVVDDHPAVVLSRGCK